MISIGTVSATFQTLPSASLVVNGAAMVADPVLTTSSQMARMNGGKAAATFEGGFSVSCRVTRSYAAKGIVRYVW